MDENILEPKVAPKMTHQLLSSVLTKIYCLYFFLLETVSAKRLQENETRSVIRMERPWRGWYSSTRALRYDVLCRHYGNIHQKGYLAVGLTFPLCEIVRVCCANIIFADFLYFTLLTNGYCSILVPPLLSSLVFPLKQWIMSQDRNQLLQQLH